MRQETTACAVTRFPGNFVEKLEPVWGTAWDTFSFMWWPCFKVFWCGVGLLTSFPESLWVMVTVFCDRETRFTMILYFQSGDDAFQDVFLSDVKETTFPESCFQFQSLPGLLNSWIRTYTMFGKSVQHWQKQSQVRKKPWQSNDSTNRQNDEVVCWTYRNVWLAPTQIVTELIGLFGTQMASGVDAFFTKNAIPSDPQDFFQNLAIVGKSDRLPDSQGFEKLQDLESLFCFVFAKPKE